MAFYRVVFFVIYVAAGEDIANDRFVEEPWHIMVISMALRKVEEPFFPPMGGN